VHGVSMEHKTREPYFYHLPLVTSQVGVSSTRMYQERGGGVVCDDEVIINENIMDSCDREDKVNTMFDGVSGVCVHARVCVCVCVCVCTWFSMKALTLCSIPSQVNS